MQRGVQEMPLLAAGMTTLTRVSARVAPSAKLAIRKSRPVACSASSETLTIVGKAMIPRMIAALSALVPLEISNLCNCMPVFHKNQPARPASAPNTSARARLRNFSGARAEIRSLKTSMVKNKIGVTTSQNAHASIGPPRSCNAGANTTSAKNP